jgi:hypothetical protein
MSNEDLKAELERLRNENADLKKSASGIRMKVSEKGGVATLREAKAIVANYHKYLSEHSLIKSSFESMP